MTIPCLYWPVTVATSAMAFRLRYTPNASTEQTTTATITAGTYYAHEGAGSLATQVETNFNAAALGGVTVAITVSVTGLVTIVVSGLSVLTACEIQWSNSAATQALGTALGFAVSASDTATASGGGVATFTSDYQMPRYWTPDVAPRSDEPVTDQEIAIGRTFGGQNTYDALGRWPGRALSFAYVPAYRMKTSAETGTYVNGALERLLEDDAGPGRLRYWTDRSTLGSGSGDYYLDGSVLGSVRWQRLNEAVNLYSVSMVLWEFTA